jgi:mannose/cellobiose epimerase-like protein (N-acyl-D-glucosamine 2-epimerase family)
VSKGDPGYIGGLALTDLRKFYRAELFEEFLPFMDKYIVDHEFGGFMCSADRDGTNLSTDKVTWYIGRGIWVYSFLYTHFGRDEAHLNTARQAVDFILKTRPSTPGTAWPKRFTREGTPLTPPDNEVYGDLFIAEGLTAYSAAAGDERYLTLAKEILQARLLTYESPAYLPEAGQTYLGPDARTFPGARVLGVWMVLLRLATQMLELHADPEIEKIAGRSIDAILRHHLHPDFELLNELLAHDFSRAGNEYDRLVYIGHAIETLWMVMFEAQRRNDESLWSRAAALFRRHVEVAWDDVYGGVLRNLRDAEQNVWDVDKVLWEQLEVLIGCLAMVEHRGDPWAGEMFEREFLYVRDHFRLEPHGLPLYMFMSDRRATFTSHADRIENYHLPRYLMLSLLSVERMLGRGSAKAAE